MFLPIKTRKTSLTGVSGRTQFSSEDSTHPSHPTFSAATMKIYYGNLLALCVFQSSVWGTTAFVAPQVPKASLTTSFSYLGNINGADGRVAEKTQSKSTRTSSGNMNDSRTVSKPAHPSCTTRMPFVLICLSKDSSLPILNHDTAILGRSPCRP